MKIWYNNDVIIKKTTRMIRKFFSKIRYSYIYWDNRPEETDTVADNKEKANTVLGIIRFNIVM